MQYRKMEAIDLNQVVELYVNYYNNDEDGCWTYETAFKRIHEIHSRESTYCLLVESEKVLVGFVVGYFRQYDDLIAYDLDEIVVASEYQDKGIGTALMLEVEERVKNKGAAMIQLQAVNDEMHEHFYGKLNYRNTTNFVLKSKWIL